ncbi:MAG: CopD family protein [Candidatus Accumulibacter sp. UW20]|jgi:putative membrane protein
MHLLKLLHFAALLLWCGTLLYLPALIAQATQAGRPVFHRDAGQLMRWVFTGIASPAALLAIASGTLLFVGVTSLAPWLILKLSAVTLLVIGHALCGVLILKSAAQPPQRIRFWCTALASAITLLIGAALWLVLAKPSWRA